MRAADFISPGRLLGVTALAVMAILIALHPADALAQAARNPFSIGVTEGGGAASGLTGWLLAKQSEFYRLLTGALRLARTNGAAGWSLIGLSFLYGVFHAAGPGHGKAVVTAYLVANERALKRGLAISAAAALLQAVVAITLVAIASILLGVTARTMTQATELVERASFAAIAALGLWLVWRKGRGLAALWRANRAARTPAGLTFRGSASAFACPHGLTYGAARSGAAMAFAADDGGAAAACGCGVTHAPDPARLGGVFSWREAVATVFAAGLRPCSGAILVLVFAVAQGMMGLGAASALAMAAGTAITTGALAALAVYAKDRAARLAGARGISGAIVMGGLELLAAFAVLLFGLGLFIGAGGLA